MTIPEAIDAARKNSPITYEDAMLGAMLFGRIGAVRKDFATLDAVRRGKDAETYALELLPISSGRSVMVVDPARVRLAKKEELADVRQYPRMEQPQPREELICAEVMAKRAEKGE